MAEKRTAAGRRSLRGGSIGVITVLLLAHPGPVRAQDGQWPLFRGPDAGAVADDPRLPETWSETEHVVWKADVPGLGWSSPVVWDDHIFLTTAVSAGEERAPIRGLYDPGADSGAMRSTASHRWLVYDLDFETGVVRWVRELHTAAPAIDRHLKNSYASETPVTDGERLYVYVGSIGLVAALDLAGEVVWTRELGVFTGRQRFGTAASPALHDGRLYLVNGNTTQSFLVAFDAATGDELWRVDRDEVENWVTPFVWGKRAEDRNRHPRPAAHSVLRSGRARPLGARWADGECGPHAVRTGRAGLRELGLPGWDAPAGLCDSPGCVRRHFAEPRREWQRLHRLVSTDAGHLQHVGAGLRRPLLHAARSGLPPESRCPDRS